MKKIGVLLLLLLVLTSSLILAQEEDPKDPYQCLEDLIESRESSDLSLQEAIFSTLALGSQTKLAEAIDAEKNPDETCWPSNCKIKETAQVLLVKDHTNQNTNDLESWLLSKNGTARELTWFLQIDISNHDESSCTLFYRDSERTVTVNNDMTISGNPGSCFTISDSGFWLNINNNCMEETFRISCDKDFITSLLYQKQDSAIIYITPTTNSAPALGITQEKINSQCFRTGNSCDYEGTLWAALALDKSGYDSIPYLPYLTALAESNQRFFPSAFLFILTGGNDQYSEIIESQQQGKFWEAQSTPYNRFYDTALALLALQETSSQELTDSLEYLESIKTPENCWNNNNIRDTAFILYAGFPKSTSQSSDVGGGSTTESCIASGYDCVSSQFSCLDAGGQVLDFDCDRGVCCSVQLLPPTCAEQNGIVCTTTQTCTGTTINSLDGSCCLGSCQGQLESECESSGGACFTSCTDSEEQTSDACDEQGLVCCIPITEEETGSNLTLIVIILIILIVLVILSIVFRKKLQIFWLKIKSGRKGRNGPDQGPTRRPPYPPYGQTPPIMRRPPPGFAGSRFSPRPMPRQTSRTQTDKDLDETLKKLKDMSK